MMDNPFTHVIWLAVQLVLGITLVLVMNILMRVMMRRDGLLNHAVGDEHGLMSSKQESIKIVDGFANTIAITNHSFNTVNPGAHTYRRLPRSTNQRGGAQFTYSLWMDTGNAAAADVRGRDILLRGDPKRRTYWEQPPSQLIPGAAVQPPPAPVVKHSQQVVVQCPRISFGNSADSFVVTFNTLDNPAETVLISPNTATTGDTTLRHNAIKLAQQGWALLTFVFEDHVTLEEDGISVRFYLNDMLYHQAFVKSTLRQNVGDLVMFPNNAVSSGMRTVRVGDVTYHNRALHLAQVQELFARGPPKHAAKDDVRSSRGDPAHLSIYNRLDMYNT